MDRRHFLAASAASLTACSAPTANMLKLPTDTAIRTGGARMIEIGNGNRVWTKKIGDAPIKVLLLHGGPGADHTYFECFEDFLPANGCEFYYYDQLDSGFSDHPGDPHLWNIERFREEVETVRKSLGLEQFYLLGHSWGGMLAIEYALAYGKQLKGLIISNMTASIPAYEKYVQELRAALPAEVRERMDALERSGRVASQEYEQIVATQVYTRHLCRLNPWPEPIERSFRGLNQKIYNYLQGPNEFLITGTLKGWDRMKDLPEIKTPTLVMGAKYDEMNPEDLKKMAASMPNARAWISDKGSHMTMWDDQVPYFMELLTFLKA